MRSSRWCWMVFARCAVGVLGACGGSPGVRRQTQESANHCLEDGDCPAGLVCREAACVAPDGSEIAIRPLEDRTSETLYRRLAAVDFGEGRGESGTFHLTVAVGHARTMEVEDALVAASVRARFTTGLKARLWALTFHAKGGEVVLGASAQDPERRFVLKNIAVESTNEAIFQLQDDGFPRTSGTAVLDLTVTADLGATDSETLHMTAKLREVPCHVAFDIRDGFMIARLAIAETRTLFGVPDGLSVEAIAIESEVTGSELPKEWL